MKKLIFAFLLLFSINGYCEWTIVQDDKDSGRYSDYSTKQVLGNYVRIWSLTNFKKPAIYDGTTLMSTVDHYEYDCQNLKFRSITTFFYSKSMGSGSMLKSFGSSAWMSLPPHSIGMYELKILCQKN